MKEKDIISIESHNSVSCPNVNPAWRVEEINRNSFKYMNSNWYLSYSDVLKKRAIEKSNSNFESINGELNVSIST